MYGNNTVQSGQDFVERLQEAETRFRERLQDVGDEQELEQLRVDFLGRKGSISRMMAQIPGLPEEDRPRAGRSANQVKKTLQDLLSGKQAELEEQNRWAERSRFDPSLPGRPPWLGSQHPVTLVQDEICSVFISLGYEVVTGPEVETDFYNFEALNIPQDHPARDMQDTLYVSDRVLLRTHTSPLQIRTMLRGSPPLAAIAPGKVYRRDADLTHTPMFHQIEGFLVDENVNMAQLRGTLTYFAHKVFGKETKLRFRPSFFPFTEPSAEVDISCVICRGGGRLQSGPCRVCKQTGWVEILGCGMIDPEVFRSVGYDPERYTGFAFGLGVERVAMLKFGIDDLRMFFDNDLRFLTQFESPPVV
jgi:phenylalanyl-tRNA synthetase alpha chain